MKLKNVKITNGIQNSQANQTLRKHERIIPCFLKSQAQVLDEHNSGTQLRYNVPFLQCIAAEPFLHSI